ncbi:hypothetical protein [Streptomyces sp. NRRL B-24720]|uniref:hypothetical protein n=1 Tax=Streptomyces sp. NRRL B-24720 TaxID=1476876 RepID=UPI0004C788D4|nr:hypothetical protein [Streptomyces sp. NRRL B-24720]
MQTRLTRRLTQADLEAGRRKVEHVRGLAKHSPKEQRTLADTRAQQAEQKKQKRKRPIAQPPTDNGVITKATPAGEPDEEPAADNGVLSEGSPQPSEQCTDNGVISPVVEDPWHCLHVPWHNPQALDRLAREHMTAEYRRTLAKFLAQE